MAQNKEEKKNTVIDVVSDTLVGTATAAIGLITTGPLGAIGGAMIAPTLSATIKDFAKRLLSRNESARVENTFLYAVERIKTNLENGKTPRTDNFWLNEEGNNSQAQMVLEGTLLKSRDEYEEKKLIYYSNFLANIGFNANVTFEKANILLRLIEQLSYRQLIIIAYLSNGKIVDMNKWDVAFKDKPNLETYFDFYSEMTNLYNLRLLQQACQGVKLGSAESKLSTLGQSLSALMELTSIPIAEQNSIEITINSIQSIIQ